MTRDQFTKKFEELKGGTPNYATEGTYDAWYRRFKNLNYRIFSKVVDHFIDLGEFPDKLKDAISIYTQFEMGGRTNRLVKECGWCEKGRIYAKVFWDRIAKRKMENDYVFACGICWPNGDFHLRPLDPREHEKLSTRPNEAGGPVVISQAHIIKQKMFESGENVDQPMAVGPALEMIGDLKGMFDG